MPINSSNKACRGDTVFFGATEVVEVAIICSPADGLTGAAASAGLNILPHYHILAQYCYMAMAKLK
ncbi:MAG TPA: hypothetical protein VFT05_14670 [Burkholderiaceae bacterium]|nr:hypothetical protein [Burkholderiaceae bacterium]